MSFPFKNKLNLGKVYANEIVTIESSKFDINSKFTGVYEGFISKIKLKIILKNNNNPNVIIKQNHKAGKRRKNLLIKYFFKSLFLSKDENIKNPLIVKNIKTPDKWDNILVNLFKFLISRCQIAC